MQTKLTLTIEQSIIEQAKLYAKEKGRSLSELIENYLKVVLEDNQQKVNLSPSIKKLKGSIKLPEDVDFWDFDCKYGHTEQEAKVIHLSQINKCMDEAEQLELASFYLEILAKPGYRNKKQDSDS